MDFNNYEPPENPEKTIGIIIIIIDFFTRITK